MLVSVWDVSYRSWEAVGGALVPIRIRGFAARPAAGSAALPGVVQAHGLGGYAEESHATGLAALLGTMTLAYTGPGGGTVPSNTSEGLPSSHANGYRMFDVLPDPRGSWFWAHAVAAMRGLTCLGSRPDTDPARLGMTGFSAGAVATLMSAAVDDRVIAAVPLSGTGAWDVATQAPQAWQHTLLSKAGLSITSPEWAALQAVIDAEVLLPGSKSNVLMVNGTTDEFFPLTAHVATWNAIPGASKRTSLAGNFDHGCYSLTGIESAATIEARAEERAKGGQRAWFGHWFGTDPRYATIPQPPVVSVVAAGPATVVTAIVDGGGSQLEVEEVKYWWSNDDSFAFGSVALPGTGGGTYQSVVAAPLAANTVYFVDVLYRTRELVLPQRFSVSSVPVLPAGHVPHIRAIDTCL